MLNLIKFFLLLLVALALGAILWVNGPIPQSIAYHHFADQRMMLHIPNFFNIISNGIFLFVGILGLIYLSIPALSARLIFEKKSERWFYIIFFIATLLVSAGSTYYHWNPNNTTLIYDRLPIAIAFMSFFAAMVAERISRGLGLWFLPIAIVCGLLSIYYWYITGDLRPYVFVQIYVMLAIPLLLLMFFPSYTGSAWLWLALFCYLIAKITEYYDIRIYDLTLKMMSGHTIKHIAAGISCYCIFLYLLERRLRKP